MSQIDRLVRVLAALADFIAKVAGPLVPYAWPIAIVLMIWVIMHYIDKMSRRNRRTVKTVLRAHWRTLKRAGRKAANDLLDKIGPIGKTGAGEIGMTGKVFGSLANVVKSSPGGSGGDGDSRHRGDGDGDARDAGDDRSTREDEPNRDATQTESTERDE